MTNGKGQNLTRIGVFYDGNYFLHVSNFYNYFHERKSRISVSGLHRFITSEVAQQEGTEERLCRIVDAHYFRGRLSAGEASQRSNQLFYERIFDDILMSEGVTTHYLPVRGFPGQKQEKGIDVSLALEAFELAFYKRFNVLVLIASDGDYVPLIRKLNSLGTRVMVLAWDFEYTHSTGQKLTTRTSQDLLEEASYPVAMHEVIDNRLRKNDPLIHNIFVPQAKGRVFAVPGTQTPSLTNGTRKISTIQSIKNGFGFIKFPPNNLFFYYQNLLDTDFNDLKVGDKVQFTIDKNEKGEPIAIDVMLMEE